MTRFWPWTDLDIDPVNDERAVKRAYSKKLKAIDPERDAAGFIELRSAYDYALSLAKHGNADYDPDDDDWDYDEAADTGEAALPAPDHTAQPEPDDDAPYRFARPDIAPAPAKGVPGTDDAMAKLRALHAGGRKRRTDEIAVKAAFDTLMASADFENIMTSNQVEHDLAVIIDNSGRRAFFLAELTDYHFGWTDEEARFGLEWPINSAQQVAKSARFFRHIEQRKPRSEQERLYSEAFGWFEQGPTNWFKDLGRRKRVQDLLETLQTMAPTAYYALDERKIAAWEQRGGTIGAIGWPMANFMLLAGIIMAAWLDMRIYSSGALWPVTIIWAVCSAALFAALMYRRPRLSKVPDFADPLPVPMREWAAYGVIMLLIPAALFAPPHIWWLIPISVAGGCALACTAHPGQPKAEGFWDMLAQRRYGIAAFWIAAQAAFADQAGQYLFLPTAIAAWMITHAHPNIQASLDRLSENGSPLRRWHLHAAILAVSVLLLVAIAAPLYGMPQTIDGWIAGVSVSPLARAAAIMLLLCHDAVTGRHIVIPGLQFYLLRVVAAFMLFTAPTLVMMILISIRTLGILVVAFRDARAARENGTRWRDHGDGYVGGGGEFSWSWIGGAILVFTILRIFLQAK